MNFLWQNVVAFPFSAEHLHSPPSSRRPHIYYQSWHQTAAIDINGNLLQVGLKDDDVLFEMTLYGSDLPSAWYSSSTALVVFAVVTLLFTLTFIDPMGALSSKINFPIDGRVRLIERI